MIREEENNKHPEIKANMQNDSIKKNKLKKHNVNKGKVLVLLGNHCTSQENMYLDLGLPWGALRKQTSVSSIR